MMKKIYTDPEVTVMCGDELFTDLISSSGEANVMKASWNDKNDNVELFQ